MTDIKPVLYLIIPCYNEEKVLPLTAPVFLNKLQSLINVGRVSDDSRVMFVNDGSGDSTWDIILKLAEQDIHYIGIAQSRNRGHQNALIAGLSEAVNRCDITVTVDCDGQDDINALDDMLLAWSQGCEVVYGVRKDRAADSFFKRTTAQFYYSFLKTMDAEVIYNHADYRLISSKALKELLKFNEVNLYLRGMVPLVGFKSTTVEYIRRERQAGESHYSLKKMYGLAIDGITSLSVKPLRIIVFLGAIITLFSFAGLIYTIIHCLRGGSFGWPGGTCIICFVSGIQLVSIGVIGEYAGRIYMETKHRPRYIISDRTDTENNNK